MFAADVSLSNGRHDRNTLKPFSGTLIIGNDARIIGPLEIGDNVVVGAGSVIIRDVPAGSIVAGVPAKVIGMRDLPEKVWHYWGAYYYPKSFTPVE